MVRFACRSKRIEDIRNAARVVSYMLEEGNRHDQIVFTADWILNGLDDKSIVYVVTPGLLLYVQSDISVLIILGQKRSIDSSNFENISRTLFEARIDSPPQFILVRRKSEKTGESKFKCPAQCPIASNQSPQTGHQLPSDPGLQGHPEFRGLAPCHRDARPSMEVALGSNSRARRLRHHNSPIERSR
jgi:hypothetical protein